VFNCKELFKLQVRPPNLILLITASQDRWIFPSQSWEVRNSMMMMIILIIKIIKIKRDSAFSTINSRFGEFYSFIFLHITLPGNFRWSESLQICCLVRRDAIDSVYVHKTTIQEIVWSYCVIISFSETSENINHTWRHTAKEWPSLLLLWCLQHRFVVVV